MIALCVLVPAMAQVTVTEEKRQGVECYKVATPTATYCYDKAGAGFCSMFDREGNDWLSWKTGGAASGEYRGIPNMGLNKFGHPGYSGAKTITSDKLGVPLPKATISSSKDKWSVTWEFLPDFARMTVHGVGEDYWLLYEGTPGGEFSDDDYGWRCDGTKFLLKDSWGTDLSNTSGVAAGAEFVVFCDSKSHRSLVLLHDDDKIEDSYYPMKPMTVFGFGRPLRSVKRLMNATPATLVVAMVEARDFTAIKPLVDDVWKAAKVPSTAPASRPASRPASSSVKGN
jgi:hypothetical protein